MLVFSRKSWQTESFEERSAKLKELGSVVSSPKSLPCVFLSSFIPTGEQSGPWDTIPFGFLSEVYERQPADPAGPAFWGTFLPGLLY